MQVQVYNIQLQQYDRQRKAFTELMDFIYDTIALQNIIYIQSEDPNPWSILRALKARLAPTDEARSDEIEAQYQRLIKGPENRDLEAWLRQYERVYTKAKLYAIGVVVERAQRDFLLAVTKYERAFGDMYMVNLCSGKKVPDMYELIEKFRELAHHKNVYNTNYGS